MTISFERMIPTLRIFHVAKAHEFYVDYLGFALDWEHRHDRSPVLIQVSLEPLVLRLSEEHHPTFTAGATVTVEMRGLHEFHMDLKAKDHRHTKPSITEDEYGTWIRLSDPFGNQLQFNEPPGA